MYLVNRAVVANVRALGRCINTGSDVFSLGAEAKCEVKEVSEADAKSVCTVIL